MREPLLLAIDTSCDDTSVAVVRGSRVLSNIISSQHELHAEYGGVVPILAKRAHAERIDQCVALSLEKAGVNLEALDAIAVTIGPGLAIALEVGIKTAKELAKKYDKKLIAINHMEGHLYSVLCSPAESFQFVHDQFSAIVLLVSGGHTELHFMRDNGVYELLGETLDDAVGEAFDKVARMLGLGYPGGAVLAQLAEKGNDRAFEFPIPLRDRKNCEFSYSGLKASVSRQIQLLQQESPLSKTQIQDIAASFQRVAILHLMERVEYATRLVHPKTIICGGGVSANLLLRKKLRAFAKSQKMNVYFPRSKRYAMDNAAMIGVAGSVAFRLKRFSEPNTIDRDPTLPLTEVRYERT
ncbi:MAG: putative tRNA threonylcarbamoyladenosine biosynthesis protein Gcp [Microgenomates group bacterium GW2011_GWF2_45_18]|nr:MAG: putative tRNA threonylcarbamoyladenosine biosynthesis protein Gcp [Microgenomates group bacterium GW2011_GWF1_44_10]KKU02145.1 MAG: putative tRNA threonylcarbamoyladenosine biosynthesis protein Gcp [Microgenomates group bacterium GW2011_GWF2_45_18]OGJ41587.1 MAG: tRNA (adenosine(37)-N6)-threonylcarbamoyltransferase complex transferase subunit TsaD [Candidatus Pacebacteria bacterium RIFOXYB1_FULL_44_10]HAU98695.1 tRNA (adenosine(37)-N6)-threonylcarbamoyltransferase complex transferase sub